MALGCPAQSKRQLNAPEHVRRQLADCLPQIVLEGKLGSEVLNVVTSLHTSNEPMLWWNIPIILPAMILL